MLGTSHMLASPEIENLGESKDANLYRRSLLSKGLVESHPPIGLQH